MCERALEVLVRCAEVVRRFVLDLEPHCRVAVAPKEERDLLAVNVINSRDVEAVQTISSMGYDVNGEHYVQNIKQERTATLDGIIERSGFPKKRVQTVFPVGNPADELLQTAIRENVDLIVMGIKGRSNLEYIFVGSVAEKIFQRSPVPVVSFRDQANAERFKNRIHPR